MIHFSQQSTLMFVTNFKISLYLKSSNHSPSIVLAIIKWAFVCLSITNRRTFDSKRYQINRLSFCCCLASQISVHLWGIIMQCPYNWRRTLKHLILKQPYDSMVQFQTISYDGCFVCLFEICPLPVLNIRSAACRLIFYPNPWCNVLCLSLKTKSVFGRHIFSQG